MEVKTMKKIVGAVLVCFTLVLASIPAFAWNTGTGDNPGLTFEGDFAPGEVIVKFKQGVNDNQKSQIHARYGLSVLSSNEQIGFQLLGISRGKSVAEMAEVLNRNPHVEYAEPNYIYYACMTPNDPIFSYQWHMHDISQGGINVQPAWDMTTGTGAVVAIVDTGISRAGEDLTSTSFVSGYDFVNGDTDPTDDNGHGTHCAGTVAQSTNNGVGVCGVAFGASLMPVKVLDRRGSGWATDIADGIIWATDHGANVISMSLGSSSASTTIENAVAYAYNHGVTCVAASGNEGGDVSYPAAFDAYVIAVGATRYDTQVTDYSNHGSSLDVVAPGGDSNVDQNGDGYYDGVLQETFQRKSWGYYFFTGTSMACPHVAGVAALLYSYGVTSPDDIRTALQNTAVDLGDPGWDQYYGYGLIDAYAALNYYGGSPPPNAAPTASFTYTTSELTASFTDTSTDSDGSVVGWSWNFGDGATSTAQNPSHTYAADGTYTVSLTVTDDDGATDTTSQDVTVSSGSTGSDMWVSDISWRTKQAGPNTFLYYTVTVMSDDGPVSSATVYSTLTGPSSTWDFSGTTDSNGQIEFGLKGASAGTYTAEVTAITHSSYTYNEALDVDNPDSYTV